MTSVPTSNGPSGGGSTGGGPTGGSPTGGSPTGGSPSGGGPDPIPGTDTPEAIRPRVTCRRCHRPLHDPESRILRLGPECRDPAERVARFDVDQDPLPGIG
ncbi:DUF6011 domain-containing protein [Kitasatospora sp. NPDC059803]|uniref:DUF6011 domain-containing protein n=1 Tax=Kitasatospora sp. NPDC059803 TaxID=3346953 RepID=UPI00365D2984